MKINAWCIVRYCDEACEPKIVAIHAEKHIINIEVKEIEKLEDNPNHHFIIENCSVETVNNIA